MTDAKKKTTKKAATDVMGATKAELEGNAKGLEVMIKDEAKLMAKDSFIKALSAETNIIINQHNALKSLLTIIQTRIKRFK